MHQVGNIVGFVDKRQAPTAKQAAPSNADNITTPANFADDASLDARLTAISGTTYSAAQLAKMTRNDKVFAVRKNDEAGSF